MGLGDGKPLATPWVQFLGGKLSFFQSVCVLGYCIFPVVVGCILCITIPLFFVKPIVMGGSWVWATRAATGFLTVDGIQNRKMLALYPVCLFYFVLCWLTMVSTSAGGMTSSSSSGTNSSTVP